MKKEQQMLGRRMTMGAIFSEDHERLSSEGFLETVYIPGKDFTNLTESLKGYHKIDRSCFIHPDSFKGSDSDAYLLKIIPQLGINDFPKAINCTRLT